ncbi:HepT-like ribonuclease domain-containing protein [Marinomonas mediterranea]|uniref:HepT-like ribonuclease domain-containing protein n=1 Tax=Marinomonas mediterranea TaxID=119864 RepID=UPI003AEF742D
MATTVSINRKAIVHKYAAAQNTAKRINVRNTAVHNYQTLDLDIAKHVVENKLGHFTDFIFEIRKLP